MASKPPSILVSMRSPPLPEAPKESAVSRLLIAPLTFVTFLISLFLIDSRNNSLRAHSHPQPQPRGRVVGFFHGIIYRRIDSSSPYAYVRSPNSECKDTGVKGEQAWHWHSKQRKMMKAEVADAFQMRKRVVVVFVVLVGAVLVGIWMSMWWVWKHWTRRGGIVIGRAEGL